MILILTNFGSEFLYDIKCHENFLADIASSLSNGRMHHAWLLVGPVGIGKASMARLAAAWLLSEGPQPGTLLGMKNPDIKIDAEESDTSLVLRGAHPDYKIIAPQTEDNKSGQIKIDQIRKLFPFMMHKPARGGWRSTPFPGTPRTRSSTWARTSAASSPRTTRRGPTTPTHGAER